MDGFLPDLQVLDTAAVCAAVPNANEIHPELADPSLINLKAWLLKIGSFINQSSFWALNRLSSQSAYLFVCTPLHIIRYIME